jgi:hypothetical protein
MVEMDNLGTNYAGILHCIVFLVMPSMVNLNANLGVKALSFITIQVDNL